MGQREVLTVHTFFRPVMLYLDLNGVPYVGNLLIKVKNYFLYPPNDITNIQPFKDRQWLITWQGLMHCKIYNSL